MDSFNERGDQAFDRFWAGRPGWWIEGLEQMSMLHARDDDDGFHPEKRAAMQTMAHHLVREHARVIWEAHAEARRTQAEGWAAALRGDDADDEVQTLALAVEGRRVVEVVAWLRAQSCSPQIWDRSKPGPRATAIYRAATLLRGVGELEAANHAFALCPAAWYFRCTGGLPVDEPLVSRSGEWRFGVPSASYGGPWVRQPVYSSVDLRRYDWVIGCGTTIRHRTLTRLGVPRARQVILEVHHGVAWPFVERLPRLRGRVAVVDDLCEGRNSQTIARIYDADVIDVGDGCAASAISWLLPTCTVNNAQILEEVGRR